MKNDNYIWMNFSLYLPRDIAVSKNASFRTLFTCIIIILSLLSSSSVCAQEFLFNYIKSPTLTKQQKEKAAVWINDKTISHYEYVTINIHLLKKDSITFNSLKGKITHIKLNKTVARPNGINSLKGSFDHGNGHLNLVTNGGMITGTYHTLGTKINIMPIGGEMHLLLLVNDAAFKGDESPQGYQEMLRQSDSIETATISSDARESFTVAGDDCNVRVLVAYTDDVANALADVKGFVQNCIDITNDSYDNSLINFHIELARSIEITYTETGDAIEDLERFRTPGDGYLDEVFNEREYYDADLCALLVQTSDWCGYSSNKATYDRAFCVVQNSCAVGNYTFPHELGHLYGARHDECVTPTPTPYPFGHGYIYLPDKWRTIMAYPDCCPDGCPKIPYFSNPAIYYNGVPIGTIDTNDVQRVHELEKTNIMSLNNTDMYKSFPSARIKNEEVGDVIAISSINNSSFYTIDSGASVTWRTGSTIILKPGFKAIIGSRFHGFLDKCTEPGAGEETEREIISKNVTKEKTNITTNKTVSNRLELIAYPNPARTTLNVDLVKFPSGSYTIIINNISGQRVMQKNVNISLPKTSLQLNIGNLPAGVYFIQIAGNTQITRVKFVKE